MLYKEKDSVLPAVDGSLFDPSLKFRCRLNNVLQNWSHSNLEYNDKIELWVHVGIEGNTALSWLLAAIVQYVYTIPNLTCPFLCYCAEVWSERHIDIPVAILNFLYLSSIYYIFLLCAFSNVLHLL